MSKIFEALRRCKQEVPSSVRSLVDQAGGLPGAEPALPSVGGAAFASPAPEPTRPRAGAPLRFRSVRIRLSEAWLLPFDHQGSPAVEHYRIIRTKIVYHPRQPRVVVIASAETGDGKSTSAINIAGALALNRNATALLVDGDFRRASLSKLLGVSGSPGLIDVLAARCTVHDAIVRLEPFPNLYFLPAGKQRANTTELLDSPQWKAVCGVFRERFQFTIVDSPPVAAIADYDLLHAACVGVILVVRPDHTNRTLCFKALESIPQEKLTGVLMNCVEEWFLCKTLGYYLNYYDYSDGAQYQCTQT